MNNKSKIKAIYLGSVVAQMMYEGGDTIRYSPQTHILFRDCYKSVQFVINSIYTLNSYVANRPPPFATPTSEADGRNFLTINLKVIFIYNLNPKFIQKKRKSFPTLHVDVCLYREDSYRRRNNILYYVLYSKYTSSISTICCILLLM